jgi:hypothetical protein
MTNHAPCVECFELEVHELHHDLYTEPHDDACNYEASWEGEETGWVPSMLCHEYEPGCYCADAGKCEVCVDQAVDYADYLRDAAKEE